MGAQAQSRGRLRHRRESSSFGGPGLPGIGIVKKRVSKAPRGGSNPKRMLRGIDILTNAVRVTLGSKGRNVVLDKRTASVWRRRSAMVRGGVKAVAAELLEDTPGALWSHGSIEASRLRSAPQMTRVVVAIDPAVTSGEEADETGIIVAGKDHNGHGYVLADLSGRYPPTEWARLAITAYRTHRADRIVAEVNNGGDMVGATLRMVDPNVAFTAVRASRGKVVRAEPVAALYQQGRVHHIGTFPQLEDQMTNFTSDIDRAAAGYSPDRVDALVWAFSELLVEPMKGEGIYELYRQQAKAAAQPSQPQPAQTVPQPGSMEWLAEQEKLR